MEWYQGGIAEAVTESRKNGSIFVVYIEGNDDQSKQVSETINTPQIAAMLNSKNFVAIHVESNSVTHQQFSEIYKQTVAPSIYFIGKTGLPLEIITDSSMSASELSKTIDKILVKNGGQSVQPIQLDEETPVSSAMLPSVQPVQEVPPNEPHELAAAAATAATTSSQSQITMEEKLRIAQELIAKKRKEKEEEEREKERNKEIERRKLGQDVQKMKRWQQDQDIKNLMDERQKERRADQEARERVRRQIEEDKREKAARMHNLMPQQPQQAPEAARVSVRPANSHTARLQFRLPDGSQITHDFKSSACLQEVIDYLQLNQNQRDFILSTTFPKREFSVNDASQSLLDLQLVPNAAMLVLPRARRAVVTSSSSGGISGMFWYLLTPILSIFAFFKSFIWGSTPPRPPTAGTSDNRRLNNEPEPSGSGSAAKQPAAEGKVKRQGNVHRLHEQDSDEDNNTWNGNSTQQM